jgi:tetratricopeptide (TPR) repeat protein
MAIMANACASKGEKEDLGGGLFNSVDSDIIVMRAGDKDPIISQNSRMKWLDIKKSEKDEIRRMQILLATGDSLEAEREARKFLQGKPGDIEATLVLASSLAQSRQYELADYFAQTLEKFPQVKPNALNIRGLAVLLGATREQDFRKAQDIFLQAHKGNPKQIAAGLNLGALYLETGNANGALGIYQETSVRCSKCTEALMGYGIAALRAYKFKDAENAFNEVIGRSKRNGAALYHLGLVYLKGSNNKVKAEATLKRVLQEDVAASTELKQRAQLILKQLKGESTDTSDGFLDVNFGGDDRTEDILTGTAK